VNLLDLCVSVFSATLVPNVSHTKKKNEQEMITNVHSLHVKHTLLLSDFHTS